MSVTKLDFNSSQISDRALSVLQLLSKLEELSLSLPSLSDEGMEVDGMHDVYLLAISSLICLEVFDISLCEGITITDIGVAYLCNLVNLKELT